MGQVNTALKKFCTSLLKFEKLLQNKIGIKVRAKEGNCKQFPRMRRLRLAMESAFPRADTDKLISMKKFFTMP
jgi:hypothetical protein